MQELSPIHEGLPGCAFLVWTSLKRLAAETGRTVHQLKHGLLDGYIIQQLKNPSLEMKLA